MSIIQLSELLENYNEKSAHRWVGNFSLQILTDLHSSKIPLHGEFPVSQAPAFGLEDAVCGKGRRVRPRFSPYVVYPRHDHISHTDSRSPPRKNCWGVTSLSRYAVEVFLVSLGFLACRPDDAVFVMRRAVDSVQL